MSALLWLLVALPAAAGAALALARPRSTRLAWAVTLTTAAAVLVLAVVCALVRPAVSAPFLRVGGLGLAVDPLAAVVLVTVAAVALLVLLVARVDVTGSPARFGGLMLLFVAAVVVTVTATTLPALLLAWELMGATSYALIGFAWWEPGKTGAGATAFLVTRTADLGLYLAAGAALAGGHCLALADLAAAPTGWRTVVAAGIAAAALGKAAQLPFTFWLSRAMEGPSPVSALLHSAAMVAMGAYLLLRVPQLLALTPVVAAVVAWLGAATTVLLGMVALAQRDLKQVLAASTAAQLGFVVLAAGVGGVAAGTAQLVAHAATKALLFLVAGLWLAARGTKQLDGLRGAACRWRALGVLATVGLLGLAGAAPLALWATKEAVLAAVSDAGLPGSRALWAVGLVGAALSAAYAGRVLGILWAPLPADGDDLLDTEEQGTRRVPPASLPSLVVLALGAAGLGLLVAPPVLRTLIVDVGGPVGRAPGWPELVGSAALAAGVVVLAAGRRDLVLPSVFDRWLGLEPLARRLVVDPTLRLARGLARFDDRTLAPGVEALGRGTVALAGRLARVDDGGVDAGVLAVARTVQRAGRAALRPQTGQLHQYYLSGIGVLTGAVVLLVLIGR